MRTRQTPKLAWRSALAIGAAWCAGGCYGLLPAPNHKDRLREASAQERERCDAQAADPRVYGPDVVERVGPLYAYVQSIGGREARMRGAELRLRPLPGMTPELLARALMCRSAAVVLGHAQAAPNEPYSLPDGWVKIAVRSEDASFVVTLEGEDLPEAKEILARAQAFAAPSGAR